jgi:hypothetical protein
MKQTKNSGVRVRGMHVEGNLVTVTAVATQRSRRIQQDVHCGT